LPLFQGRNTIGLPAPVAQWTEHQPSKLLVVGSNPARGADFPAFGSISSKENVLMPTIVRKSISAVTETRREVLQTVSWHVRSNIWSPPTDVYETQENYVIKVEIAGMRDEDFEVAFENNVLRISGYRPDLNERRAYHQMEIRFGRFELALELPITVDLEHATAEYKDGFLVIVLPKSASKQEKVEKQ
jgi:HSP20 family protein